MAFFVLLAPVLCRAEARIKIGVPTALTGDAASFGMDIKNALEFANDKFGGGRYQLIIEDEKCSNKDAVTVAQKLIHLDKVQYALGFPCNQTLLATAGLYNRAGVVVITGSATSGDVTGIGSKIFRLFPSDVIGAELLFKHMSREVKKLLILTEQSEFPVLMERSVRRFNKDAGNPLDIETVEFEHGKTDLRTPIIDAIRSGVDAIYLNANTDASFITVAKQISDLRFPGRRFSVYLPSSSVVVESLGDALNGYEFANLPLNDDLVSARGKALLNEFRAKYGEPQSGFPVVPISLESFRLLDIAIRSGVEIAQYLREQRVEDGVIPPYSFDDDGAVEGINFEMQVVRDRKVVRLNLR